ncbi:hypothetical protein [Chitinimonas naiadis]
MNARKSFAMAGICLLPAAALAAQPAAQKSSPPTAQAWLDLATYAGGMPGLPGGAGGLLGGLFGGSKGGNVFGNTQTGQAGRWLDVTLYTRNNTSLREASQKVPEGSKLAPSLKLISPVEGKPVPVETTDEVAEQPEFQKPKGKMYLYWGCGSEVRKGQPKVLDMAKADVTDFAKFFQSRRATTRGAHSTPGRPVWPNKPDSRLIPEGASLVGEHAFSGDGVPDGFKFSIDADHDLMPTIDLKQTDDGTASRFNWQAMSQAKAFFIASMGMRGQDEMVIWTSSELPDIGFGLLDYQPNASVDRWLKEKVLLSPRTTECAAPKEAVGQAGMVRMIAYGEELNLAYPPRPKDPKTTWEPVWAAKLRLKSVATHILGMPAGGMDMNKAMEEAAKQQVEEKAKAPGAIDLLKGIFGK